MNKTNKCLLIAYLIGVIALVLAGGAAGSPQSPPGEPEEPEATATVDEITVYGRQSLLLLRKEFERAQENMFVVFNALNSTDEFDVECDYVQRLGSRRWHHECIPKFATRQINQDGAGVLVNDHHDSGPRWVPHTMYRMNRRLWEEMAEMVKEHPDLKNAFTDLAAKKEEFEAERERRRAD